MIYGVATAAYQIEGAGNKDGRTPCIWDEFAKKNGNVYENQDGMVACDHYHLYKDDIKLMKDLGVDSYRLSIAWPRIFPKKGEFNQKGMDFYIDLLKELNDKGIKPSVTLYHWDLPMWAYEEGGWCNRECTDWFVEFATKCFEQLDKYVYSWITHNEPWCAAFLSHIIGAHAPGHKSIEEGVVVAHHILLSHGKVVDLYKNKMGLKNQIGITLNFTWQYAASDSYADQLAANNQHGFNNRWFLDAVIKGEYPVDIMNLFAQRISNFDFIQSGDMELISINCDFLGINYYCSNTVRYEGGSVLLGSATHTDYDKTFMGWDITPQALREVVEWVRESTDLPIIITENGSCWDDKLEDGQVHDKGRVDYLNKHLQTIADMNKDGLNITGYYAWSFLDNYEWAFGYSKRFGIVYVDYETQERIPKDSYYRYKEIIANNIYRS